MGFKKRNWKFLDWLSSRLLKGSRKNGLAILVIFLVIVSPVAIIAVFSFTKAHQDLTAFALSRRQAIAYLSATTIKEKLDRLTDIGLSLATRVRFSQLVGEGKWQEAVEILRSVPEDFPFINWVFITDLQGSLMADTPEHPGVRGRNLASRDWYRGVSRRWEPYISEVFPRVAEPRYNVIAVAVPIKGKDQNPAGILVLQIRVDTLLEWTKGIEVGPLGFVFVVDRGGKIVAHPGFEPHGEIIDFSGLPAVQKVLRGGRGVEVLFNPVEKEKRVVAYEPVPGYGWGVIAQQPAAAAFASRDSSLRLFLAAYALIGIFSCSLTYLIAHFITQRKRAEESLRASEEKFRAVAETANDAIVSANSLGNITYFNKGAERMFGYSADEVVDKPLTLLMPERFQDAHRQSLKRFLSTGEAHVVGKTVELVGRKKAGTEFPLELSLASWKSHAGTFFTGILRDIIERKRAEENIKRLNENLEAHAAELEAANKELEAFSYSVSHDLRAPLRAVDGFSRILLEDHAGELSAGGRRYIGLVRENATKMGQLIDDLLTFSRLSRQPLRKQRVTPADLARVVLQDLSHQQSNREIEVSVDELPACHADPALLKQVWVNLLSNALKYTRDRDRGKIRVGYENRNGEVVYFVRDNGVGFDMRYVDKLFGVFQRLHRAEDYEGTGVGLAIVQRILHRHGGRVWAEAELNKGATFYFTLGGGNVNEQ